MGREMLDQQYELSEKVSIKPGHDKHLTPERAGVIVVLNLIFSCCTCTTKGKNCE